MAKSSSVCWERGSCPAPHGGAPGEGPWHAAWLPPAARSLLGLALCALAMAVAAQQPGAPPAFDQPGSAASSARPTPTAGVPAPGISQPRWLAVPRLSGRLRARDIGLVINTADPYSVAVGAHYIAARQLRPEQVLRLELPLRPDLGAEDFERLQRAISRSFGPRTQALALAWVVPYAVGCNSLTGALAMGLDLEFCRNSCAPSRPSPYFNAASFRPWRELGVRPSMLLAAPSVEQAKALINRGVAADRSLHPRSPPLGQPKDLAADGAQDLLEEPQRAPVAALMLATGDAARRVRMVLYPSPGPLPRLGVEIRQVPEAELQRSARVLMALTGSERVKLDPPPDWVPGGLGDHLTSFGGALHARTGQSTALEWIASGATASHGSVSEPCNHLQKFPHPQALLLHYLQGSTALEAYWKSVAWPQQSLFIGEPLAAPFSPD